MYTRHFALAFLVVSYSVLISFPTLLYAAEEEALPSVTVQSIEKISVTPSITFNGRAEAVSSVALKARVNGFLESISFNEGDVVTKDQVLFGIEREQYKAQVDAIKGNVFRLRGTLKLAEIERDRRQLLVRRKQISQEELDRAMAGVTEAQGQLLSEQANLEQAELNLSYTEIKAPFTGTIGVSYFDVGDVVSPLSGDLAVIVSKDPMYVNFPVSQRQLLSFREKSANSELDFGGAVVKIRLANGDDYAHTGKVNFIDVLSNPSTDTTIVRAEFPNPEGLLVHQQLLDVVLEESDADMQLAVPQRALLLDQIGAYVLTVDDSNTIQVTRIELGDSVEGMVVVVSGLEEGAKVVVQGGQRVRPGMKVNATEASSAGGGL